LTARSDLVVICHVDIEDELFGQGTEGALFSYRLAVAWVHRVDWSNLETDGGHLEALFAELIGGDEGLVTNVGVIWKDERKFAVAEVGGWYRGVVQPLKVLSEWEETLVERA